MCNEAITWCAKLHPGKGPKGVLFCLADKAGDHDGEDWVCFPSLAYIVEYTDYSHAAVKRNLVLLWREGYISRKRRRRADGRLGIYDYTLHRDAERRAQLKAAREAIEDVDAAMESGAADPPPEAAAVSEPECKMRPGPELILTGATAHFGDPPGRKMSPQEPSKNNPHLTLTPGAREPGDEGWDKALALWPDSGKARTSIPAFRSQWARCCGEADPARLMAALRGAVADPALAKGDFGYPGLHSFMAQERWRFFLPAEGSAAGLGEGGFAGPPALRAEVVERMGEAFAGWVLDKHCGCVGGVITPATPFAAKKLAEVSDLITKHGCELGSQVGSST